MKSNELDKELEKILVKLAPRAEESYHIIGSESFYAIKESDLPVLVAQIKQTVLEYLKEDKRLADKMVAIEESEARFQQYMGGINKLLDAGYTQKDVAGLLGYTPQAINYLVKTQHLQKKRTITDGQVQECLKLVRRFLNETQSK